MFRLSQCTRFFVGTSHDRLAEEKKRFDQFQLERVANNLKPPKGDGVLIFDEVKVVCHMMWNSRNHKIVGLSMSHEDLASLSDIFSVFQPESKTQQTSYVLQFLWRDLTSPFDVVGPYFTSACAMESKFICHVFWNQSRFYIFIVS